MPWKSLFISPKIENAKISSSELEDCIRLCFYTLFCRTSSCSTFHHAHFSQQSHTLEERGEHVEQVILVTKVFLWLALWLCPLCPTPPSSHYSPTCYMPELTVKPSMDCVDSPHECSFLYLVSDLLFILNLCSCLHLIFSTFRVSNPWGCLNFKSLKLHCPLIGSSQPG